MCSCRGPHHSQEEARAAIAESFSWAEALRRLGMCHTGGSYKVLRKYAAIRDISTGHFSPCARNIGLRERKPLEEILVERFTYSRNHLKRLLCQAGLKVPQCELCGQGELWRGRRMGLVLDHVNGISTTTGSKIFGLSVPTAQPHSTRTVGESGRRVARSGSTSAADRSFDPSTPDNASARELAESGIPAPACRGRVRGVLRDHRTRSSCAR